MRSYEGAFVQRGGGRHTTRIYPKSEEGSEMEQLRMGMEDVAWGVWETLRDEDGQGTTEYAILVGVLVVIAILSIITFKGKVQQLWDAISSGIGAL